MRERNPLILETRERWATASMIAVRPCKGIPAAYSTLDIEILKMNRKEASREPRTEDQGLPHQPTTDAVRTALYSGREPRIRLLPNVLGVNSRPSARTP
jgi:hypothetical protein